jgi:hypothetical protein
VPLINKVAQNLRLQFSIAMAFTIKKPLIPVIIVGIGAVVSHFLPSIVKPKKEEVQLIPETQEWKKK